MRKRPGHAATRPKALLAVATTLCAAAIAGGVAQQPWELKVCAQPSNYPASSRDRGGYEIDMAQILAEELGAELTFEWVVFSGDTITRTLHAGECDVVIGIGESTTGVESTVPFLRAPYTFVTRTEDDIELSSLDDPLLEELTIGTYPSGVPAIALRNRNLRQNVREYSPATSRSGLDRHAPILDALLEGEIDVALVYGPKAAARAQTEGDGVLSMTPVTPETDLGGTSFLQMFRTFTIGVRPHDVAFRDRLNSALSARWEEVQQAISAYGVQQLDIQRPPTAPEPAGDAVAIGVVVPSRTAEQQPFETVGEAARLGAEVAENYVARFVERYDVPFRVVLASAPNDESAVRAAERLAVTEGVVAFAGGFGANQAQELGQIAERRGLVFFNIASNDESLRGERCSAATFHVEASASMYADAAIAWYRDQGLRDWYLVHEATPAGEALARHVGAELRSGGTPGELVGSSAVEPGQLIYMVELEAIRDANPDVVLVQLAAEGLEQFYAQAAGQGITATVTAIPGIRAQTRDFHYRFQRAAPEMASASRPALWETSVAEGTTGDINETYTSRTGEPMEPSAWATYAAILFTFEAAAADSAGDAAALKDFLTDSGTTFDLDLGKGAGISFRAWDNQLRQPLYLVRTEPDAEWGRRLSARVAFSSAVGRVPERDEEAADAVTALDTLGGVSEASRCRF